MPDTPKSAAARPEAPDLVAAIRLWHAIEPPHPSAAEFARDLHRLIAAFQALPAPDFQSEPADFVRILEALGE